MSAPSAIADPDGDVPAPPPPRDRWRARLPLLTILAITLVGIAAVFYGVANQSTLEPIDAASHRVLSGACATSFQQLRALPQITSESTIDQRANRVDIENTILSLIPSSADSLHPPNRDGATALREWAADWRALLRARTKFAADLRGPVAKPQLVLPVFGGAPITDRMNQWARTHSLVECETQNLQAEIVDGGRTYPSKPVDQ